MMYRVSVPRYFYIVPCPPLLVSVIGAIEILDTVDVEIMGPLPSMLPPDPSVTKRWTPSQITMAVSKIVTYLETFLTN